MSRRGRRPGLVVRVQVDAFLLPNDMDLSNFDMPAAVVDQYRREGGDEARFGSQQSRVQMPPGVPPGWQPGMPLPPGWQPGMAPQPGVPAGKPKKQKKQKQPAAPVVPPGLLPNGRPVPALIITSGPRAGERHMLRNGFLIGKQPGCDLMIEDGYTSSQHAQIGDGRRSATAGSTIAARPTARSSTVSASPSTRCKHGITIRIGSTEMRFLAQ